MLSSPILDICLLLILIKTVFMFSISYVSEPLCSHCVVTYFIAMNHVRLLNSTI